MRTKLIILLLSILPMVVHAQDICVKVDSVYNTAKLREMGNRDIRFGVRQIFEDYASEKYCLSEKGESVVIEIYYFGIPRKTVRVVGVEKTNQITQVGVRIHFRGEVYEGLGESDTEIRTVMLEVQEGQMPFEKMTVSNALKKALEQAILQLP